MSFGIRTRAVLSLTVCAALFCVDQVPGAAGVPVSGQAPTVGCLTLTNMTEEIVDGSVNNLGGPDPYPFSVGGSATYLDRLYDSAGTKVATLYGKANIPMRLANGNMVEYSDERIEFADGVLETAGFYDITQGEKGIWQYLPAVGISGRYQDMLGKRHFQITKLGKSLNGWIELCPAGSAK
jgi:hypothetical protein